MNERLRSICVLAIALTVGACSSDRFLADQNLRLSDQSQFQSLGQTGQEPNAVDPNTGQTLYCTKSAQSARSCAFVVAKPNYLNIRTGLRYFCLAGATTSSQCVIVHE